MKDRDMQLPLSHLNSAGKARMVDVGGKALTSRSAWAQCLVSIGPALARQLRTSPHTAKGNVLETARLAGIQAAKRTSELIPLCHPLPLESIEIEAELGEDCVRLQGCVRAQAKTGVEMEALTAVTVAALTVYDMIKSAVLEAIIGPARLLRKEGGKSGTWVRPEDENGTR